MIWSAFLIGIVGSFHCIGMCGPIALALPSYSSNRSKMVMSRVLYNVGRAITYSLFGIVVGLIGEGLNMAGLQQSISIIAGALILIMVVLPSRFVQRISILKPAVGFTNYLKQKFGLLLKRKSASSTFLIGVLNGFLPCGLVYIAIAGAFAAGGLMNGALYMFMFGLGTIPLMLIASIAGNFVNVGIRKRINKAVPVFMIALAFLFIVRGMNLGIPYISPQIQQTEVVDQSAECH